MSRMVVVHIRRALARALHDKRIGIDMIRRLADFHAARNVRPLDDKRNAGDLLVHGRLAPQPACAEIVAVVGCVEHARIFSQSGHIERAQHLADVVVEERAQAVIRRDRFPEFLGIEEKSEYSENDLEQAIIDHLQKFLLI